MVLFKFVPVFEVDFFVKIYDYDQNITEPSAKGFFLFVFELIDHSTYKYLHDNIVHITNTKICKF